MNFSFLSSKKTIFLFFSSQILSQDNPSPQNLSRLASLFIRVLSIDSSFCSQTIGFIFRFFDYLTNNNVFDFLKECFDPESELKELQGAVNSAELGSFLVHLIESTTISDEKMEYLLQLLAFALRNPLFEGQLATKETLDLLLSLLQKVNELLDTFFQ